jgi:hypothetical protein
MNGAFNPIRVYIRHPMAHTSTFAQYGRRITTSGERKSGVPTRVFISASSLFMTRETPRSQIMIRLWSPSNTFTVVRSRCVIFIECR